VAARARPLTARELELADADGDAVARCELDRALDAVAVDERPVSAPEILEHDAPAVHEQHRVPPRDERIVEEELTLPRPPDVEAPFG
jgi:hypothetical protein